MAANVLVFRARPVRLQGQGGLAVQPAFQNRLEARVGAGLQLECALAGGFEPQIGVCFAQAHNAQTSPVSHLRMGLLSRIVRTACAVAGPAAVSAQWISREGVHSRWAWWLLGICSRTTV